MFRVVLLVAFVVYTRHAVNAACPEPKWLERNNVCYLIQAESRATMNEASIHCANYQANVVSIADSTENDFVHHSTEKACYEMDCADSVWLGLTHPEESRNSRDGWIWQDGTPYDWQNWHNRLILSDEPNDDSGCVRMWLDGAKWGDDSCTDKYMIVCERAQVIDEIASTEIHSTTPTVVTDDTTNRQEATSASEPDTSATPKADLETTAAATNDSLPNSADNQRQSVALYAGAGLVGLMVLLLLVLLVVCIIYRRKHLSSKRSHNLHKENNDDTIHTEQHSQAEHPGSRNDDTIHTEQHSQAEYPGSRNDDTIHTEQHSLVEHPGSTTEIKSRKAPSDSDSSYMPMSPGVNMSSPHFAVEMSPMGVETFIKGAESVHIGAEYEYVQTAINGRGKTNNDTEKAYNKINVGSKQLEDEIRQEMQQGDYVGSDISSVPRDGIYSLARPTTAENNYNITVPPVVPYENVNSSTAGEQSFNEGIDRNHGVYTEPTWIYENSHDEHEYAEPDFRRTETHEVPRVLTKNDPVENVYADPVDVMVDMATDNEHEICTDAQMEGKAVNSQELEASRCDSIVMVDNKLYEI